MNKSLYAIQNMVLKKRSSGGDDISDDIHLDIKPFVRMAPLTGENQLFLHIELKSKIGLNWDEWSCKFKLIYFIFIRLESNIYLL